MVNDQSEGLKTAPFFIALKCLIFDKRKANESLTERRNRHPIHVGSNYGKCFSSDRRGFYQRSIYNVYFCAFNRVLGLQD